MKRILLVMLALAFMATPAFGGSVPEFDAVGDDTLHFFNGLVEEKIIANVENADGVVINHRSDFINSSIVGLEDEVFEADAGPATEDPCYADPAAGQVFNSVRTGPLLDGEYEWTIVLQLAPVSDLDVNIHDCVTQSNVFGGSDPADIWSEAAQTGRVTLIVPIYDEDGEVIDFQTIPIFSPSANPDITIEACPGPWAVSGFKDGDCVTLDTRQMPGLDLELADETYFTSKAMFGETFVVVRPVTGEYNSDGYSVYSLRYGDAIKVTVHVPTSTPVDVRYGQDSVSVHYIGEWGVAQLD